MATHSADQLLDPQLALHLKASKYYMLASVVILYFDYVLTFDLEVRNLWRKRLTGPSILFLLNRYYPMLVYIVVLRFTTLLGPERCENFKRFPLLSALGSEAIIGTIVILRLYALHGRSKSILYILCPLYILQLLLGGWAADAIFQATGLPPGSGCIVAVPKDLAHRFAWLWGSSAVFDTLVFGLTMYRVLPLRRAGLKLPLTTLFLRDGIVYFAVMFSARLLNFILFWASVTPDLVTLNWTFNNTITVIMINRLVLNLRQESSRGVLVSKESEDITQPMRFMSTFVSGLEGSIPTDIEPRDTYETLDEECVHAIPHLRMYPDTFVHLEDGKG